MYIYIKRGNTSGTIPKECITWLENNSSVGNHIEYNYKEVLWHIRTFF